MITVAIPNFNGRQFLKECIDSVLQQDVPNVEILVCDDASTDDSVTFLKANYPQVRVIQNRVNIGAGATRNRLIEQAKGDYIFFLDSDDILAPSALSILSKMISGNDAVIGKVSSFISGSSQYDNGDRHVYINQAIDELKKRPTIKALSQLSVAWGRLISTDFLKKNNICFSKQSFMEDALFCHLFALSNPRIGFVDDVVLYIREHNASQSASIDERKIIAMMHVTKEMIAATKDHPLSLRLSLDGNPIAYMLYRTRLAYLDVTVSNKRIFSFRDRILIVAKLLKLTRNTSCFKLL